MKDIVRETHITCVKKTVLMVTGRFMNFFGGGSGFVDEDSYQVLSHLLQNFQVKYGGKLLLAPMVYN